MIKKKRDKRAIKNIKRLTAYINLNKNKSVKRYTEDLNK